MKPPAAYCPLCNGQPFRPDGQRCTCKRGFWYRLHPDYQPPREKLFPITPYAKNPRIWAERPGLALAEQIEASIDEATRKFSMKERREMSEKLQLETNVWAEIALRWPDGKNLENEYGESVMFSLVDGRVLFVPPVVGAKIRALKLSPGGRCDIRKAEIRTPGARPRIEWEVRPIDAVGEQSDGTLAMMRKEAAPTTTPITASSASVNGQNGNGHSNGNAANGSNGHPPAAVGRPQTKLEDAIHTVIHALHSGNEYAKTLGFTMPQFTGEDIRCMVNTLIIQSGGARQ